MAEGFTGLQGISGDFPVPGPTTGALGAVGAALAPISAVSFLASTFGRKISPGTVALSKTTKIFNRIASNSTTRFGPLIGIATAGPASGKEAERVKFAAGVFLRHGFPSDKTIDAILAKTRTFANSFDPVQGNIDATKEDIANRVFPGGSGKAKFLFEKTKRTDLANAELLTNEGVNLKTKAMRQGAINTTARGQIHDFVEKELFDLATLIESGKPITEQPQPEKPGVGPDTLMKAAGNILRLRIPRLSSRARGRGIFPGGGGGDFTELEKDQNLIIPSGFISKQATTRERAIDPNILEGIR